MPSYVITGGRGIGAEFAIQYSADPTSLVVVLVRNPESPLISVTLRERKNVHFVRADVTDVVSLRRAAEAVSQLTGGTLDVLINNAGYFDLSPESWKPLSECYGEEEGALTKSFIDSFRANVLSTIYTTNTFLPLLRRSTAPLKKVISLSSAAGDVDFVRASQYPATAAYGTSKAGLNFVMTKYGVEAELRKAGFIFLSLSPGWVNTVPDGVDRSSIPPEVQAGSKALVASFQRYKPDLKIPEDHVAPEVAVRLMRDVIEKATLEQSGSSVSQFGDKQWL